MYIQIYYTHIGTTKTLPTTTTTIINSCFACSRHFVFFLPNLSQTHKYLYISIYIHTYCIEWIKFVIGARLRSRIEMFANC